MNLKHRRRICVVAPYAGPVLLEEWSRKYSGGAEVQQVVLARALAERGHEVSFIIQNAETPPRFEVGPIQVHAYRPPRVAPGINAAAKCARLWRLLAEIQPEVIYQRMADWTTGVCAAFARSEGAALIHAVASDRDVVAGEAMDGNWWQSCMYRWGLRRASLVLAQHGGQVASLARGFCIEARLFPSLYADPPTGGDVSRDGVFWVAMLRRHKRPEMFLELAQRLPHVKFVMVAGVETDPPSKVYYEEIAAAASRLPNVRFPGFLSPGEIDRELGGAAALVSTTEPRREGLPVAFLQAWRQAVPTIGFAAPGLSEVLLETGWSVGSMDELAALAARIRTEPQTFRERGVRAQAYFREHHAMSVVLPKFEALMEEAVAALSRAALRPVAAGVAG